MQDSPTIDLHEASPSLAHRFNNFLTVCMTHAEVALESGDEAELENALEWILRSARSLAPEPSSQVQHELGYGTAREEAARG